MSGDRVMFFAIIALIAWRLHLVDAETAKALAIADEALSECSR